MFIFGIYTLYDLGLLIHTYTVIARFFGPKQQTLIGALSLTAISAYTRAILTPFILAFGRPFPVAQKNILRKTGAKLSASRILREKKSFRFYTNEKTFCSLLKSIYGLTSRNETVFGGNSQLIKRGESRSFENEKGNLF